MSEMDNYLEREKIIKAIECRLNINESKYKNCLSCTYRHDIDHLQWTCQVDGILEDMLNLLRETKPRIMTPEEVSKAEIVWYEQRNTGLCPAAAYRVGYKAGVYRIMKLGSVTYTYEHEEEYGVYWRCWTARPSDEEMKGLPWNSENKR